MELKSDLLSYLNKGLNYSEQAEWDIARAVFLGPQSNKIDSHSFVRIVNTVRL